MIQFGTGRVVSNSALLEKPVKNQQFSISGTSRQFCLDIENSLTEFNLKLEQNEMEI